MKIKRIVITVIVLGLSAAALAMYLRKSDGQAVSYRTAAITRGDLMVSISATGTVEPEEVIDIGAQIAGQILEFGRDKTGKTIDYGSDVEAGMILARIDDSLYAADAAQAAALVQVNKASLQRAEADIEQMKAKLYQAQRDWERAQKLGPSEALAVTSYDAYQAAYETARANLAVGQCDDYADQGIRSPVRSGAQASAAQPELLYDQVAGQGRHHRPPGQYRADGCRQSECAQPFSDRQRPQAHAGLGGCQRGGYRQDQARSACKLHG